MHVAVFLNSGTDSACRFKPEFDFIVAADGGYNLCVSAGIIPDIIIGDMDSAGDLPDNIKNIVYPAKKDYTDCEIVLRYLCDKTEDMYCTIFGGLGGRADMSFSNLLIFYEYWKTGKIRGFTFWNNDECIFSVQKKQIFSGVCGERVSFFCFEPVKNIVIQGLEYSGKVSTLSADMSRGISNCFIQNRAEIQYDDGFLLCWHEKNKNSSCKC